MCTVTSDLSEIPASRFKKTTRPDGYSYYRIEYELRMSISGEVIPTTMQIAVTAADYIGTSDFQD